MPLSDWSKIQQDSKYWEYSPEDRAIIKSQWFRENIAPTSEFQSYNPDDQNTIFKSFTAPDEKPKGKGVSIGGLISSFSEGAQRGLTTELPGMVGGAIQFVGSKLPDFMSVVEDTGKAIKDWSEAKGTEWFGPEQPREGAERWVYEGTKMLAPSVVPGGVVGAGVRILKGVGTLVKAAKAAQIAGDAAKATELFATASKYAKQANNIASGAVAGLFGLSQAQQTVDAANEQAKILESQGKPEEAAKVRASGKGIAPVVTGAIEAGGEFFGTKYLGKLFRLDEADVVKRGATNLVKDFLKTLGVEVGTEIGQSFGEAQVEKTSGIRPNADPLAEALDVIGPTTFMTLLTGGAASAIDSLRPKSIIDDKLNERFKEQKKVENLNKISSATNIDEAVGAFNEAVKPSESTLPATGILGTAMKSADQLMRESNAAKIDAIWEPIQRAEAQDKYGFQPATFTAGPEPITQPVVSPEERKAALTAEIERARSTQLGREPIQNVLSKTTDTSSAVSTQTVPGQVSVKEDVAGEAKPAKETKIYRGSGRESAESAYNEFTDQKPVLENGTFWALNEKDAGKYGPNAESKAMPEFSKPLTVKNDGEWRAVVSAALSKYDKGRDRISYPNPFGLSPEKMAVWRKGVSDYLKENGHDALIVDIDNAQGDDAKALWNAFGHSQVFIPEVGATPGKETKESQPAKEPFRMTKDEIYKKQEELMISNDPDWGEVVTIGKEQSTINPKTMYRRARSILEGSPFNVVAKYFSAKSSIGDSKIGEIRGLISIINRNKIAKAKMLIDDVISDLPKSVLNAYPDIETWPEMPKAKPGNKNVAVNEPALRDLISKRGESKSIGDETGIFKEEGISKFINPNGSVRYVFSVNGKIVSGFQVMDQGGGKGIAANAYTIPEYRKKGIGSSLAEKAKKDFPKLAPSEDVSKEGRVLANIVEGKSAETPKAETKGEAVTEKTTPDLRPDSKLYDIESINTRIKSVDRQLETLINTGTRDHSAVSYDKKNNKIKALNERKGSLIKRLKDVRNGELVAPPVKEKPVKQTSSEKQAERIATELAEYNTSPSKNFIEETLGKANQYQKTRLARFLDGTENKYSGGIDNSWVDGLRKLGFSEESLEKGAVVQDIADFIKNKYGINAKTTAASVPKPTPSVAPTSDKTEKTDIESLNPEGVTVDWSKKKVIEKDGLKGTYYATYNKDGSFKSWYTKTEIERLKNLKGTEGLNLKQDNYGKQTGITQKETKGKQEGLGLVVEDKNQPGMFGKAGVAPVKTETKETTTEDSGEELSYNRRNRIRTGIKWEDLADKNTALKVKETTKQNVYPKPDYEQLIESGQKPFIAHLVKQVYDSIASKPSMDKAPTDEDLKTYITAVNRVMDGVMSWANNNDAVLKWAEKQVKTSSTQPINISDLAAKEADSLLDTVYPKGWREYKDEVHILGGNKLLRALQPGRTAGQKAMKDIQNGWPGKQESWQKQGYKVIKNKDVKISFGYIFDAKTNQKTNIYRLDLYGIPEDIKSRFDTIAEAETARDNLSEFILTKKNRYAGQFATEEEAKESARNAVKREGKAQINDKGISVTDVEREGVERRLEGENITSDKLKDTFGFRGINFGNWMKGDSNQAERQTHLNYAYDSFLDLAEVLGVPPKAMSLNGMLGLAIGAQGSGGNAAAHFVPGVNEINLTRTSGAGSLAHEFGHAVDHYFANQAGLQANKEPFLTEHTEGIDTDGYIKREGKKVKAFGENIRPEIVSLFSKIVKTMNKKQIAQEDVAVQNALKNARAKKNIEGWIGSIKKDFMAGFPKETMIQQNGKDVSLEQAFDVLSKRIIDLDLGEGRVSIGRVNSLSPVVAELRDLYKTVNKRVYSKERISDLQSNVDHYVYINSEKAALRDHIPQMGDTDYAKNARKLDKDKGGKKYWSTDLEKFARAFDAYVSDTLEQKAAKNTYLSHAGRAGKTVPTGDERTEINKAFASLVSEIKTKETDKGAMMYSAQDKNLLQSPKESDTVSENEGERYGSTDSQSGNAGRDSVLPTVQEEHKRRVGAARQGILAKDDSPPRLKKAIQDGKGLIHYPEGYDTPEYKESRNIASSFGVELVPVTDTSRQTNGFIKDDTLFINMGTHEASIPIIQTVLHELSHFNGNTATQEKIDTKSIAFHQYRMSLSRSMGRTLSVPHVLAEYAADLEAGVENRYGADLNSGLKKGETVETIKEKTGRGTGDRYIAKERRYAEKRGEHGPFHDAWRVYDTYTDTWGSKIYSDKINAEKAAKKESALAQSEGTPDPVNEFSQPTKFSLKEAVKKITDNPAFVKWFGKSQVINSEGEPLIVYHGSDEDFNAFDTNLIGDHTGYGFGAFYFNRDKKYSDFYGRNTRAFYLKAENLFDPYSNEDQADEYNALASKYVEKHKDEDEYEDVDDLNVNELDEFGMPGQEDQHWLNEAAKDAGYDGVVYNEAAKGSMKIIRSYAVFSPTQIKSIFNQAFDPNNPDIRYQMQEKGQESNKLIQDLNNKLAEQFENVDAIDNVSPPRMSRAGKTDIDPIISEKFDVPEKNSIISAVKGMFSGDKITMEAAKKYSDTFRTEVVDRYHPIKALGEVPYMLHRMLGNSHSVISAFLKHGKLAWKDQALIVTEKDKGFLPWLHALKDDGPKLFYWMAAKRAAILEGENRENWLDKTARNQIYDYVFKDLNPAGRTAKEVEFKKFNAEFQVWNKNIIDIARESGLLNQDQIDAWMSDFYLPFYRLLEDEVTKEEFLKAPRKSKQYISAQIKRLKGGEEKIGDPIENILRNWSHLIQSAQMNVARETAADVALGLNLAKELSNKDLVKVLGSKTVKAWAVKREGAERAGKIFDDPDDAQAYADNKTEDTGKQHNVVEHKTTSVMFGRKEDFNIISYQREGKPVYIRVDDPYLFNALSEMNAKGFDSKIIKAMSWAKRLLTTGATFAPAFRVANFLRDTLHTAIVSKNFMPFIDSARGFIKVWKESPEYIAYMASGGAFDSGWIDSGDPKTMARAIEKIVKREGEGVKGLILNTPRKMLDFWEKVGKASENAARVQLYSNLTEAGETHLKSAFEGRDLLDFYLSGAANSVRVINAVTPFFNARMQGLDRLYRGAKANPKTFFAKGLLMSAASLMLWALWKDDDRYKELEDWDKWMYHHFWIGNQHFRLPKAFETGAVFSSLFESAANVLNKNEDGKFFLKFLGFTLTQTFAVDMPAALKPGIEIFANKSLFTGRAIENMGMQRLPAGKRSRPWTSDTLKALGEGLNISPVKMEHIIQGHTSTFGAIFLAVADSMYRIAANTPAKPSGRMEDIPAFGRFIRGDARNTKYATRFYELSSDIDELTSTINYYKKLGDYKNARQVARTSDTYKYKQMVADADKNLTRLRLRENLVWESRSLSPKTKRDRLDAITKQKNEIYKKAYEKAYK